MSSVGVWREMSYAKCCPSPRGKAAWVAKAVPCWLPVISSVVSFSNPLFCYLVTGKLGRMLIIIMIINNSYEALFFNQS